MKRLVPSILAAALLATTALPQDLLAVKAGKLITITGDTLENAVVLIENGRIKQIGTDIEPSWEAKVIDASDRVVMPTYVLAHTTGGLSSDNENLANVPYLTVQDAIDPSSSFYEEALRNGIGTLHVIPGNNTLLGGQSMIIRPFGRTVEDMAVRANGAIKLSLSASGGGRMAQIRKLQRALDEVTDYAKDFDRRKAEFAREKEVGATEAAAFTDEFDPKKKPVLDLLEGKRTAFLYVPSSAEVSEALRIASSYKFETVMVLGAGCHQAAARFAKLGHPVVLEDRMEFYETDPLTDEDELVCTAAKFAESEVPFALSVSDGTSGPTRYPWWQMATAIRHGVSRQQALAAMTIVPAKILGLDGEVGSLEAGKVANLQILTGDPLAATTWVETVILEGAVVYERSKDARLSHLFGKNDDDSNGSNR